MSGIPVGEYDELVKALDKTLAVKGFDDPGTDGQVIRRHVAELDSLPKMLLAKLRREGLREILIGPGSVPDFPGFEFLRRARVSGQGDATWDERAGAYAERTRVVALGTSPTPLPGTAIHEVAHALGDILGYYYDFRVTLAYKRVVARLDERLPGAEAFGIRAPKEFFANSVLYVIIDVRKADEIFGSAYIQFIQEVVMKGRAARTK